ncbi:tetratricopeptide repeat protein [bacterium]|nr:tetratricopeptide repeat protein [bacterium]
MYKKTLILCILLIISTTCWAGHGEDYKLYLAHGHKDAQWDNFIESGFIAFDSDNLHTAFIFLQRSFDKGCKDGLALFKLGIYHENQQNYKQALDFYMKSSPNLKKHYSKHKYSKNFNEYVGRSLFMLNDFINAQGYLEDALKNDPKNFMLLFMTGQILRMQMAFGDAVARFTKALEAPKTKEQSQNSDRLIYLELIRAYYEMGDYDKAIELCDKILMIEPNNGIAMQYKQQIFNDKRKSDQRKHLQQIIQ